MINNTDGNVDFKGFGKEFYYQRAGQVGLSLYLYNHIIFHKANLIHFSIKIYYNHSNPSRGKCNI